MADRAIDKNEDQVARRDPGVAPPDMIEWLFGRIYDGVNGVLELFYYFAVGIIKWIGLLRSSPVAMIGLGLILFWVVAAIFAPAFTSYDPNASDLEALADPTPGGEHWLGTDILGRDIWARIVYGAGTILTVAPLAVLVAYIVGCTMGLVSGYYGGWVDTLVSRISDVILAFPVLVIYMILISAIGPSAINIIVAVTIVSSPGIGRIVRGLTLDLRNQEYVQAAQIRGESSLYIMLVELLPNARGPLIVDFCLRMGYTTIIIGVLGFLGLGLPPPDPDWGGMVKDTYVMVQAGMPHMSLIPCFAITSLVIGFNLLADGMREIELKD